MNIRILVLTLLCVPLDHEETVEQNGWKMNDTSATTLLKCVHVYCI